MQELGYHQGYRYAHDYAEGIAGGVVELPHFGSANSRVRITSYNVCYTKLLRT